MRRLSWGWLLLTGCTGVTAPEQSRSSHTAEVTQLSEGEVAALLASEFGRLERVASLPAHVEIVEPADSAVDPAVDPERNERPSMPIGHERPLHPDGENQRLEPGSGSASSASFRPERMASHDALTVNFVLEDRPARGTVSSIKGMGRATGETRSLTPSAASTPASSHPGVGQSATNPLEQRGQAALIAPSRTLSLEPQACTPPLSDAQQQVLWHTTLTSPGFRDARRCLVVHYHAKGDDARKRQALEDLLRDRSSRYDPAVLLELATLELRAGRASDALRLSHEAERYQARMAEPRRHDSVARIQEVQALAHELQFQRSQDGIELEKATQCWQRYQDLMEEQHDLEGTRLAGDALSRLDIIRNRLP